MKFVISSGKLFTALQRASGALGFNSKLIPIIENFLIELSGKRIIISATNMDIAIQTEAEMIESESDGAIVVPSTLLMDALKSMPDHPINFEVDEESGKVEITSEYGKYTLNGFSADDFPEFKDMPEEEGFKMSCESFEKGYRQTVVAAVTDEMRKGMQGVSFKVEDGKVIFAATDAHRLIKNVFYTETGSVEESVLLPRKDLLGALKPLLKSDEDLLIQFSQEKIFYTAPKGVLICRLAEGNFPNYEAVIPSGNPNKVYLDRVDFINTIKRVSLFSNQATYQVILDLSPQSLTISASDIDFNRSGNEQFPCTYEGEPLSIAFNGRFIVEMLNVLDSEQIRIEMLDSNKATLIFPDEKLEGQEITMLIMPVGKRQD